MIQAGFSTVRDPRNSQANSNGTNEKARRAILSTTTDMTTKQNGSGHQGTAAVNGTTADHPIDISPTTFSLGASPTGDETLDWPSSAKTTVNFADRHTTNDQQENI